jgi:hypothetical protein
MARLTDIEKAQLLRPFKGTAWSQPAVAGRSLKSYIEFATFASRFSRVRKPIHFVGTRWKL